MNPSNLTRPDEVVALVIVSILQMRRLRPRVGLRSLPEDIREHSFVYLNLKELGAPSPRSYSLCHLALLVTSVLVAGLMQSPPPF